MKLTYSPSDDIGILCAYVDSDILDRKSTSGYVIQFFSCNVLWVSKKQRCVAISSTEAEYLAVSNVCKDVL